MRILLHEARCETDGFHELGNLRSHLGLYRPVIPGIQATENDHKLITAQTRDRVALAHTPRQPVRHAYQQLITDIVTQRIVQHLEVIQINQ